MEIEDIVMKLVGPITPVGSTHIDNERFENLKVLCDVANKLISEIDSVGYMYKDAPEYSIKRSSDYAIKFLTDTIGISD